MINALYSFATVTNDDDDDEITTSAAVLPVDEPTVYVTLCVYPSNAALVSVTVYFPYGALLIT